MRLCLPQISFKKFAAVIPTHNSLHRFGCTGDDREAPAANPSPSLRRGAIVAASDEIGRHGHMLCRAAFEMECG